MGHNYEWLLQELSKHGYFELAPYDLAKSKMWRVSFRKRTGCYHGWKDIKFFHKDPWYALSLLYDYLTKNKKEE